MQANELKSRRRRCSGRSRAAAAAPRSSGLFFPPSSSPCPPSYRQPPLPGRPLPPSSRACPGAARTMPSVPLPPKESNLFKRILVSPRPRSSLFLSPLFLPPPFLPPLSHTGLARCPPTRGAAYFARCRELAPTEGRRMRPPRSPGAGGREPGLPPASSSRFVPVSFLCLGPAEQAGRAPLAPVGGREGLVSPPAGRGREGGREPGSRSPPPPPPRGPPFPFLPVRHGNSGASSGCGARQRAAAPSPPSLSPQAGGGSAGGGGPLPAP